MPSINVSIGAAGPLINLLIGISLPRSTAMKAAGLPVPTYVHGTFLIDTGASCTCVDPYLVAPLSLVPTGSVPIQTPSTAGRPHMCNQYDASLFFPNAGAASGFFIDALPVIETELRGQGIDGLIGRDVLDRCTLIYNGTAATLCLAY
jgi:hypothetical protein